MILALCGTVEGEQLVELLLKEKYSVLATVTTGYGAKCLGEHPSVEILRGKLTEAEIDKLVKDRKIQAIVDVTHPFAAQISSTAIKIAKANHIPYVRYERQKTKTKTDKLVFEVEDFQQAAELAKEISGTVFLTIGSNHLPAFIKEIDINQLVIRVLPLSNIIKACEEYGFSPDNIIAMKGPFTVEINRLMFLKHKASVVVTKDSGTAGGTEEKIEAAHDLGIPIIIVKRPQIDYGQAFDSLRELVNHLGSIL